MKYKFFTNSQRAWAAMYQSIKKAKDSVYIQMYIFDTDTHVDFFDLLKQKAAEGVRVRMILDSFGSSGLSNKSVLELRESGAEVYFLSHLIHRMHKKILVVDESMSFVGGVNISKGALNWNDLMLRVYGSVTQSLVRIFARDYERAGGGDTRLLSKSTETRFNKAEDWLIEHLPHSNKWELKKIYKEILRKAKTKVVLVTPYFIPKRWLLAELHNAVLRGVTVELLVPKDTEIPMLNRVNLFYFHKVSDLGVNVYLQNRMNHAKVVVTDDVEAIVGSQNLDFLSFDWNSEIGVVLNKPSAIKDLLNILRRWRSASVLFSSLDYKPKRFDFILSPIIKIFSWIV